MDTAPIARLCGVPEAQVVLARSASAAFHDLLRSLDLDADAEILLPVSICASMVLAALAAGAVPVIVDCDETFAMSAAAATDRLTPHSRVLVFHHPFGRASDLSAIRGALARRSDVIVVEDCAQAPGTAAGGRTSGSAGDVALLSFGARKPIDAGVGGALVLPADTPVRTIAPPSGSQHGDAGILTAAEETRIFDALAKLAARTAQRLAKVQAALPCRTAGSAGPPADIHHRLVLDVAPSVRARAVERFADICEVPQPPGPSFATPGLAQRYRAAGRDDLWDPAGDALPIWHALAATRLLVRTDAAVSETRLRQLCRMVGAA